MSTNKNKNLVYLDELSGYKVASDYPDIKGWDVWDADNRVIGKVDRLLVNKVAERVVYIDVEVDHTIIEEGHDPYAGDGSGVREFLNKDGDNHLIIPIGLIIIDEENKIVHSAQINHKSFSKVPRFRSGSEINPDYEASVYRNYSGDADFDEAILLDEENFYGRKEFDGTNFRRK